MVASLVFHETPKRLLLGLIWVYQSTVGPTLPKACRFEPSCSRYAYAAIERYGAIILHLNGAVLRLEVTLIGMHGKEHCGQTNDRTRAQCPLHYLAPALNARPCNPRSIYCQRLGRSNGGFIRFLPH